MSLPLYEIKPLGKQVIAYVNNRLLKTFNASEGSSVLESRLSNPNFRTFVTSTHSLFKNVQMLSNELKDTDDIAVSSAYILALRKILTLYKQAVLNQYDILSDHQKDSTTIYNKELSLLQSIYTIWNLLEITCLNNFLKECSVSKGLEYASLFSKWYRFNFPSKDPQDETLLLQKALMVGDLNLAHQLLSSFNSFDEPHIKNIISGLIYLLKEHPIHDPSNESKIQKYRQNAVLFNGNLPNLGPEFGWLVSSAKIICGDKQVLLDSCDNFLEYQCGLLVFGFVKNSRFNLEKLSTDCFEALGEPEFESDFILSIASLLKGEFSQFFVYSSKMDLWLSAHITDFCFNLGIIDKATLAVFEVDPREYFLNLYSSVLCSIPDYWRISLDYYNACGSVGSRMSEQVILRQQVDSFSKLLKLIGICKTYGLEHIIGRLYRTAGSEFAANSHYPKAICCYWEVADLDRIEAVASAMLVKYLCTGNFEVLAAIGSLGHSIVSKVPTLLSLRRYVHLLSSIKKQDFRKIPNQIGEFFSDNEKPNMVWPVMLIDTVGLLSILDRKEGLGDCSMVVAKSCELVMSSPFKSELYNPIVSSKGDGESSTVISQLNSEKDVDEALSLLVYSTLKTIAFF